jgi:hypothetical protein
MNRKITHHFPTPLKGADHFARWIEEYGKARHVRDLVYAGTNDALKGTLSDLARALLKDRLKVFTDQIDALEKDGLPDGVFAAIEAAFHIGESMAATRFRKEVPPIHMKNDHPAHARKKRAERPKPPNATEAAVRAAMGARTTISLGGAHLIKGKVDKIAGRDVPANTIFAKLKLINKAVKKEGTL